MKESEMNTKLKPCPFCGSNVEMKEIPLWHGSHGYQNCYEFKVTCGKCGCTLNYEYADTIYRTEEEAINNVTNAWNERKNETNVILKIKTKHWISYWDEDARCYVYECPECGNKQPFDTKYCWECGREIGVTE